MYVSRLEVVKGTKFVSGVAKIFGLVYFSPSSLLISKKRKGHLAKLFYLFPSFLSVSKKKATILKLSQGKGEFGWACWTFLGGQNFCLGGVLPPFAPLVAALPMYRQSQLLTYYNMTKLCCVMDTASL